MNDMKVNFMPVLHNENWCLAQAFVEAGLKSDLIKAHVRLHRTTVPPKATTEDEAETFGMLMLTIVDRQWKINKKALMEFISRTGNQEPILREKVV